MLITDVLTKAWPPPRVDWPEGKRFAFTIFDDTDRATKENTALIYAFLQDLGFRTTKSVWPISVPGKSEIGGDTGDDPEYVEWVLQLQRAGFEVGYHLASHHTSSRADTSRGLQRFHELFGHYPYSMANHQGCSEGIYWGDARLSGVHRLAYNLATRGTRRNQFRGHVEGDDLFWGDLCKAKVRYVRNFVYPTINTLKACPWMPYHDPTKPWVNLWFASSEACHRPTFNQCVTEAAQDQLEEEGGACILYTHFAFGFYENGRLDPRFCQLMERLARKGGWFVPAVTLLDYLREKRGEQVLAPHQRLWLETRWALDKASIGST